MKVAIVGDSISSRHLAPFDDVDWEIWGLNTGFHLERCTRLFEIHDYSKMSVQLTPNEIALMNRIPTRFPDVVLYTVPSFFDIEGIDSEALKPLSETFPYDTLRFGFPRKMFTSSFSWLAALAIHIGVDELAIYGVDMDIMSKYGRQRQGGEYWVGFAEGRGIPVTIPKESLLCHSNYLYGLEDDENVTVLTWLSARRAILRKTLDDALAREKAAQNVINQMGARALELEDILKTNITVHDIQEIENHRKLITDTLASELEKEKAAQNEIVQLNVRLDELDWIEQNQTIPTYESTLDIAPINEDRP